MIKKIVLEIGNKEIKLSLKQAKKLQEVLNDTFGEEDVVYIDRWVNPPRWLHYPYPYDTWCSSNLNSDTYAINTTDTAGAEVTLTANKNSWAGSINANTLVLKTG